MTVVDNDFTGLVPFFSSPICNVVLHSNLIETSNILLAGGATSLFRTRFPMVSHAWIVLWLCGWYTIHIARGQKRVTRGLFGEYDFLRTNCLNGILPNAATNITTSTLSFIKNVTSTSCLSGNGISSKHNAKYSTISSIAGLVSKVAISNSFTIEFWYQSNASSLSTNFQQHEIMAISYVSPNKCPYYVQISEAASLTSTSGTTIVASFCNTNLGSINLYMPVLLPSTIGSTNHIVVEIAYNTIKTLTYTVSANYTVNGMAVGSVWDGSMSAKYDASTWNTNSKLRVFGTTTDGSVDDGGNLYLLALYNSALTHKEIVQNYNGKLPRSRPVVTTQQVTIREGGEIGDHAAQPSYYLQPIPILQLVTMDLNAINADDAINSPNYNASIPYMKVQLLSSTLPSASVMALYTVNGVPISTSSSVPSSSSSTSPPGYVDVPRNPITGKYTLHLRPPYGYYSPSPAMQYCNFSFRAIDGKTGVATAPASVQVIVTHVHRPPIIINPPRSDVLQGKIAELVLNATVADHDAILIGTVHHTLS